MHILKKLFCNHRFRKEHPSIHSIRKGNDNLLVLVSYYECTYCGKYFITEEVTKVEKDYYLEA